MNDDEKMKNDSARCSKIVNSIIGREGTSTALEILTATLVMICQNQNMNAAAFIAAMRRGWDEKSDGTEDKKELH